MKKYSSIVVSNRLPVSVSRVDGELKFSASNGGLATAMSSLDSTDRVWVGWPGISSDNLTEAEMDTIKEKLLESNCYPVFLNDSQVENFYEGYANDTLWPLFHYFQSLAEHDEKYWESYEEVNKLFVKETVKVANEDSLIWIHDYHLMLMPGLVRDKLPETTIGFFLHIPFPSYEIFRQLPNRHEILLGLLGSDLIGFHIYDYARHFLSSAERIEAVEQSHGQVTFKGRKLIVDTFPIGIDYEKIVKTIESKKVKDNVGEIKKYYKNQKIIISVDRLDYTKGILNRLTAYELFLSEHPEYHKKIALTMIAVPSRTEVETYRNLRDSIELSISRINGQYASVDWTPISYQFKNLPYEEIFSMYASADIALVTPLRDGMNLVAKEYVAAKQDKDGVLILSELAGAIDELPEALSVNPNSIRSIKDSLLKALEMEKPERSKRLGKMQYRLKTYNVKDWAIDFTDELKNINVIQSEHEQKILTDDIQDLLVRTYSESEKRLLIFDYDGTLRGFVNSTKPEKASPSKELIDTLKKLSSNPKNNVCIVSGRTKEALDNWFKNTSLTLIAEHGAWTKVDGKWAEHPSSFDSHKEELTQILQKYAKRTTGSRIEEKSHALVWHYRGVKSELAYARNANLTKDIERYIKDTDLSIYQGNKILEIKPESINKGNVAYDLYQKTEPDFVLCIGDDYTDEDMFDVLPEQAFTIKVGLQETEALFQLHDVDSVHRLISKLT